MKYAIYVLSDQTILYYASDNTLTTKHGEAILFNTEKQSVEFALAGGEVLEQKEKDWDVESVEEEEEFKGREDTW